MSDLHFSGYKSQIGTADERRIFWYCENCREQNFGFEEHKALLDRIVAIREAKRPQPTSSAYD
jgi:fructosamine-3-kinase